MNRTGYNRQIVTKLYELIEKYPDWRFGQILHNCGINDYNRDIFYDESKEIYERLINTCEQLDTPKQKKFNLNELTKLPKNFKIKINNNHICVEYKTKNMEDWSNANDIMKRWEEQNNLKEIGAGTMISTGVRDWCYERKV